MPFLKQALRAPVFEEEEKSRVGKLLHWTLYAVLFILIVDCMVLAIFAPETIPSFWINYLSAAFCIFCLVLLHRGWVMFSSALFTSVMWLLIVYYLLESGGVSSPAFAFLNVGIIMAAVLLGTRGALSFGLLTVATAILLYIAGENSWIINQEVAPTAARLFGTQTTVVMALTLFMTTSSQSLLGALKRSRESEKALAEQNARLQEEILKRKEAEKQQERLAAILEATSDFVGIAAANGQVMYINEAGRKLVGLDENVDIRQTRHENYYPESMRQRILTDIAREVDRQNIWHGESGLLTKSGDEIPTSQVILVHRDAENKIEYYSTIMRDISEQKAAETQRLALAVQEERLKSFKEFLSHISHDLKTPIS